MTIKVIGIICLWALSFIILNIGAKKLSLLISFDNGVMRLLLTLITCHWFYIVVPFYALCAILYLVLLKLMPISVVGPIILCIATLILSFLGAVVFREKVLNVQYYIGIILSLAAIVLLQAGK
jgi:multidrug transporter EmrE-like cation transporter